MKDNLMNLTQNFFQKYLPKERELSPHTTYSYRDTIKIFFQYIVSRGKRKKPNLDDMTAKNVLDFLEFIREKRKNSIKTQNQRLAVLKSFFEYLQAHDPTRANEYSRIDHIKSKKPPKKSIDYLEKHELKAIFDSISLDQKNSTRDIALLKLLYNSGARVQELCNLKIIDLRTTPPYMVTLHGKGNKIRKVPLWKETIDSMIPLIEGKESLDPIFTYRGEKITRFGVRYIVNKYSTLAMKNVPSLQRKNIGPHTFRHTTAMHLLQSGTDISVIKTWLGHVDLNTTHGYIEIDMGMKRMAIDKIKNSNQRMSKASLLNKHPDIIKWLEEL